MATCRRIAERGAPSSNTAKVHTRVPSTPSTRPKIEWLTRLGGAAWLCLGGCAAPPPSLTTAADRATEAAQQTSEYVIGPGDRLSIFVYDNPQLSVANLPVRPDGRISTPLVPDVVAAGQTPSALAKSLAERLKTYVRDPNVTVMVLDFLGPYNRQVRVIGEAAEPQALPYREHMTLLDVMIQTKGLTRFAAGNSAVIVRKLPKDGLTRIPVRLSDLIKDGDISQNVEMQPGDTLVIPQSWF